jgi:hypothetical protein
MFWTGGGLEGLGIDGGFDGLERGAVASLGGARKMAREGEVGFFGGGGVRNLVSLPDT